ncbi:endolytic transglycosylase MltG [Caproiciproducens sp. NJN-50]|uniref:endolytic transglycosylase MltG n=1 Tax=Acutalibacteraceae TaxID=3082771 RepID=UPI000FFDFD26|nr:MULTISPECIES: endolytic transglycosylase MltG [Acutalibacteraceae]QAT49573.1 endolytic transglycosylase MltG [Caproiciproducens sp. NJN-50]
MNDDEHLAERMHKEKVENFRLRMNEGGEEELPEEEIYSGGSARQPDSDSVINSYSDVREGENEQPSAQQRAAELHRLRNREKGGKNRHFFRLVWFIMVLFVSLLLARYLVAGVNDMLAIGRESLDVTVDIPQKATPHQVAQALYQDGVIRDEDFFLLYAALTKAPEQFSGGSFQVRTDMDYEALITSIQSNANRVDTIKLTFREGMNALEVAELLRQNGVCSEKDAEAVFNSDSLNENFDMLQQITNASDRYYQLEGYLFPDTYEFFKNENPEQAITKLVSNCNRKLTKQIREKASDEGMTLDQMLTLASMIQAEAADKDDMYKVSSVFHNRLKSQKSELMHLDSDPTTYYPYRKKSLVPENIRGTYQSKYDTYTIEGLPPGPICNPGMDAIDAALNPSSTGYYYFCHDADGKAYYAKTASQHQANLKKAGLR